MVVVVGVTVAVPEATTAPTLGLIEIVTAPVTTHCRVEDCPAPIVPGVAVKLVITGTLEAFTLTTVVAVTDPPLLVAVRV